MHANVLFLFFRSLGSLEQQNGGVHLSIWIHPRVQLDLGPQCGQCSNRLSDSDHCQAGQGEVCLMKTKVVYLFIASQKLKATSIKVGCHVVDAGCVDMMFFILLTETLTNVSITTYLKRRCELEHLVDKHPFHGFFKAYYEVLEMLVLFNLFSVQCIMLYLFLDRAELTHTCTCFRSIPWQHGWMQHSSSNWPD